MESFLLGPFLKYLPIVFFWLVFVLAALNYFFSIRVGYRSLIKATIFFYVFYALILSAGQYYVWKTDEFSSYFLKDGLGYLFTYSWGRFWFGSLISVGFGLAFWFFLKALQKKNERFFHESETELGFLCALIAGWPGQIIFLALVFVFVLLVSLVKMIFLKESYTTLGAPFLLAAFMVLLAGNWLISELGLGVLRI